MKKEVEIFDYDLAHEFEIYKLLHKQTIVESSLLKFYKDLTHTGINIPEFMQESAEKKARKHLLELLNDREKFNRTYECAWHEFKECLP